MNSKHDHPVPEPPKPPCEHLAFRYCKPCDTVECSTCGKEWKTENLFRSFMNDHYKKTQREPFGIGKAVPMPGLPEPLGYRGVIEGFYASHDSH